MMPSLLSFFLFASGLVQPSPLETYSIASVRYELEPSQKIGAAKAGMLCLPAGSVRWNDLAKPDRDALVERLETSFGAAGLPFDQKNDPIFADASSARYRLRLIIESVKLSLCTGGFGSFHLKPKGSGTATIRWEIFDRESQTRIDSRSYETEIALLGRDPRADPEPLSAAIEASSAQFGAYLKTLDK